jgi:hypothetical protein
LKSPLVGSVHETLDRLDYRTRILRLKSPLVGSIHETPPKPVCKAHSRV